MSKKEIIKITTNIHVEFMDESSNTPCQVSDMNIVEHVRWQGSTNQQVESDVDNIVEQVSHFIRKRFTLKGHLSDSDRIYGYDQARRTKF